MLAVQRLLTGFVLVSIILTALSPAPVWGRSASETPAPPDVAGGTAPELETPREPEPPKQYLARVTPEADREALGAFLKELYEQEQIGPFQWVAEAQAFLITGEKGLVLVAARPEVLDIIEATPEALAYAQQRLDSPVMEAPERAPSLAATEEEASPEAETPEGDIFLLRLIAPQTRETLGDAYARLTFELDYLQQQGWIDAYRWLPEANAVQVEVIVPQALDFLRRSTDVVDIGFWSEAALEQARAEQQAILRDLARSAPSPRGPAQILAYTPTTPKVRARLYSNYLYLTSDTDATMVLTLTTAAGVLKNDPTRTYSYGGCCCGCWWDVYLRDNNYNPVSMLPGDILYIAQSGHEPFTMTLPQLTAYADAAANTVTGKAPPDITSTDPATPPVLGVSVYSTQYVTTTASGDYIADNVGNFNAGDGGTLRYYDARGNQTYINFRAPAVGLRGWGGWSGNNNVRGYAPMGSVAISVTLTRGGVPVASTSLTANSDGYFSAYLSQAIEGGDVVAVTTDGWSATVTAPDFTVTVDPDTDTITGHTNADVVTTTRNLTRTLAIWPQTTSDDDYSAHKGVQPAANGDFTAANPFERYDYWGGWVTTTVDIRPGDAGHARYIHADGNRTYYRFKAPPPPPVLYARGYGSESRYYSNTYLGGYITGFCSSEDGYGSATLRAAGGTLKAQKTNIYACPSIYVDFGVPIEGGDVISATFGGKTTVMTVPEFSAMVDAATDTITGVTSATVVTTTYGLTQTLTVWPNTAYDSEWSSSYARKRLLPAANGAFTATNPFERYVCDEWSCSWQDVTVDIRPGDAGHARYIHADGNRTYYRFKAPPPPPVLYARGYGSGSGYSGNTYLGGYITGFCSSEDGYGSATLRAADGTLKAQVTNINACPSIYVNFGVPIEGGDVISATFGGKTTVMTVPDFTVTVDPDTDTIIGHTNADVVTTTRNLTRTLAIWPQTTWDDIYYAHKGVQPAANGNFTAANPFERYDYWGGWVTTTVDIRPGDAGHARYIHADGNRTYYRFKAPPPPPVLYARGYGSESRYSGNTYLGGYITGFCSSEDGYGSATLRAADGTLKAQKTNIYACPSIYVDFGVPIEGGDVISATFGGKTTVMTVPDFTVTVDPDTDTIIGHTNADVVTTTRNLTRTLAIWPQTTWDDRYSANKGVQPAANGNFTAANPFERYDYWDGWVTTTVDIRPGDAGHARYIHADGNRTYADFTAPALYVRGDAWGYMADNYVYVKANAGTPVTITLRRAGAPVATAAGMLSTNNTYGVYLTNEYDAPVMIQAGDVVEAALPGQTLTVQVPTLTATPNTATGIVSGHAPANITSTMEGYTHTLRVYRSRDGVAYQVTTDAGGAYSADFSSNGGLRPGDTGWLRYINTGGYYIYENYWIPVVYVRGYESWYSAENMVSGYAAEAGVVVTATLKRGGNTVVVAYGRSDASTGRFSIYLRDQYGYNVNILGGDTLEIRSGGVTTVVPVPQFTAVSDPDTDTVTGTTDAVVTSQTPYMTQTLAIWPTYLIYGKHVVLTSGAFTATNPFYYNADPGLWSTTLDWSYGATGQARYINADGNWVYMRVQAPLKPVVYVRGYYSGESYYAENSVGGTVNGFCGYGTVTLKDNAGVVKAQTTSAWACSSLYAFLYDAAGNAAPILPGDRVEVTFGGATTVVDVPAFNVTSDHINDRLSGTTDAIVGAGTVTQTLALWPDSWDDSNYGKRVTVAGGVFTATNPFYAYANPAYTPTTLDWVVGASGHLRYIDASGNRVYARFKAHPAQPVLYLRGDYWGQKYVADNYVSGYVPGFCGMVELIVRNSSGGERLRLRNLRACHDFETYLYGANGVAIDLQPGDTVQAVFLGTNLLPVTATVPTFTADLDHINSTVTGSTDATVVTTTPGLPETLAVWPTSLEDRYYGKYVQPASGVFSATNPFYQGANPARGSATLSWSATAIGHLRYIDAAWNHVYTRVYRPDIMIYARQLYTSDYYGYASEYVVSGSVPGFCGYGSITLKNAAGTLKAQRTNVYACSTFYGIYLHDSTGRLAYIEAGDRIEAAFGGMTKTLTVPALTARADAVRDRVTGTTNAEMSNGATLTVYPTSVWYEYYYYPSKSVQPDASGAFTATNPFYYYGSSTIWVDIREGNQGHIRYTTPAGDRVQYRLMAHYPTPRVWVRKDSNYVYGYSFPLYTAATVMLLRDTTTVVTASVRTDGIGYFSSYFYDAESKPVIIREGDTVRVECGSSTIDVPVVPLTAQADAAQDAVWGVGPANAWVTVSGANQPFATGADGAYHADLRGLNDLGPGSGYQVSYRNPEGHTVYIYQYIAQINALLHSNYIWGYGVSANTPLTATLKTGAAVKGVGAITAFTSGYFSAYLYDTGGSPVLIAPGDTLEVDFGGGNVVTLPIVALTTQINTATGAITGSGPANALLGVDVDAYSADRSVMTDNAGQWATQVLDFYPGPGVYVRVRYANTQGHEVWLYTIVRPVVYVRGTGSGFSYSSDQTVSGYADGGAWVHISLKRNSSVIAESHIIASSWGWYHTTLTETIQAGDELVVRWTPRAPVTIVVPTLTADANVATGQVFGTGPANATLGIRAHNYARSATTSSDGAFSVAMPFVTGNEYIYLRYQTPAGHWIHARSETRYMDVALSKAVAPTTAVPGQAVTFTLTLSNPGSQPATGIVVTDTLPAILTDLTFTSTLAVTDTGRVPPYVWTVQDLAAGQSGVITVSGILTAPLAAGVYTNTAVITATGDLVAGNNTAVVTFTVPNVAPRFTSAPVVTATQDVPYTYTAIATDANGDTLTVTAATKPTWLTLTDHGHGTATLSGTPTNAEVGDHPVTLRVTDSGGLFATQSFTITVRAKPGYTVFLPLVVRNTP